MGVGAEVEVGVVGGLKFFDGVNPKRPKKAKLQRVTVF
jgi:hypothetical protein